MIFKTMVIVTIAALLTLHVNVTAAQPITVNDGGNLTATATPTSPVTNDLSKINTTSGFNFSGVTGTSSSKIGGFYYTDYVMSILAGSAESVVIALKNSSGVQNLSERIYSYNTNVGVNGFLRDGKSAGSATVLQIESSNFSFGDVAISTIGPINLSSGLYVVEVRGTTAGNFGGGLSLAPVSSVPEPQTYALLLVGLVLIGVLRLRRKSQASATFKE